MNGIADRFPTGKTDRFEHWNRVPDSVLHDPNLSFAARCVYAVLAGSVHQGTVATIGQRRIAELLGCHQQTVSKAVQELSLWKHVVISKSGKQRYRYHLESKVFGQKQRDGVESVIVEGLVSAPRKRLASVREKTA